MSPAHRVRQVMNAVNLSTLVGLAIATLLRATLTSTRDGLVLALGAHGTFPDARAFTIGNVILLRVDPDEALILHESRHATQWAWCVILFLPLYLLAMAWSYLATGDHWSRNWFERHAGLVDGGYVENDVRPVWRRAAH